MNWYAGNLHCHSTFSDGNAPPREVAKWYYEHGYSFISLTDHNLLTPIDEYDLGHEDFVCLPGSEYTRVARGVQTHVNGFGISDRAPLPEGEDLDAIESLQYGVDAFVGMGGLAMVNHPNWLYSFGSEEMKKLKGAQLFEVFNGGSTCNNEGDSEHESTDEIWDALLSSGIQIFGVASDDAHHYHGDLPVSPLGFKDPPGTGWVWVQAEELTSSAILESLRKGDFIASNGIKPKSLTRSKNGIKLEIEPLIKKMGFKTTFIGRDGEVLSQQEGLSAEYQPRGDELYVRAKVESSSGAKAWTQPVFLD